MENEILGARYYDHSYGHTFANSCGTVRLKNDKDHTETFRSPSMRRIYACPGNHGGAYLDNKVRVDVVQTQNGPITVGIRHGW